MLEILKLASLCFTTLLGILILIGAVASVLTSSGNEKQLHLLLLPTFSKIIGSIGMVIGFIGVKFRADAVMPVISLMMVISGLLFYLLYLCIAPPSNKRS